jgi:predicted ATPase
MDSAILEIVKLILIAVGDGVGAKVLDVILARAHGRLAVTLSDREELKAFIEEGRARERGSIQRETALETKIEFLLGENKKQDLQFEVDPALR